MKFILLLFLTLGIIKVQAGVPPTASITFYRNENNNDSLLLKGKIEKKEFVDKAGRIHPDVYDLFFKTTDATYFIKINESKISKQELEDHLNMEVELQAIMLNGAWDTNPDGSWEVQSRMGKYILILKISSHSVKQ